MECDLLRCWPYPYSSLQSVRCLWEIRWGKCILLSAWFKIQLGEYVMNALVEASADDNQQELLALQSNGFVPLEETAFRHSRRSAWCIMEHVERVGLVSYVLAAEDPQVKDTWSHLCCLKVLWQKVAWQSAHRTDETQHSDTILVQRPTVDNWW